MAAMQPPEAPWLPFIRDLYPNLDTKTYFLPPLHFNRVPRSVATFAGETVSVLDQPTPPAAPGRGGRGGRGRQRGRGAAAPPPPPAPLPPQKVAGKVFTSNLPSLQPSPVMESDIQDDQAQYRVLQCLRGLSRRPPFQVMMVISQLEFRKFLDSSSPIDVAAAAMLPNMRNQPNPPQGEFDILVIHRDHGLIIAEIKSLGVLQYFSGRPLADQHQMIADKVERAVRQLNSQGATLARLVSDLGVKVTKTLILPNVSSTQLEQALQAHGNVAQGLCQCLGSRDLSAAVSQCMCGDEMPYAEDFPFIRDASHLTGWARVRRAVFNHLPWLRTRLQRQRDLPSSGPRMTELTAWWQRNVLDSGPDPRMSADVYERLLARFCGPATTVDVPTVTTPRRRVVRSTGQAAAETGLIMSCLALFPDQVALLNTPAPKVFLWGPPGSGKTVILALKARQWLDQGEDVHVISTCHESRTISTLIHRQLQQQTAAAGAGTAHFHHLMVYDQGQTSSKIDELAKAAGANGGKLFIILDEMIHNHRFRFSEFLTKLHSRVQSMHVWAGGMYRPDPLPPWIQLETIALPLRTPPAVLREVDQGSSIGGGNIPSYAQLTIPAPTDGPAVIKLKHDGQADHLGDSPCQCERCGENIAVALQQLEVGQYSNPARRKYPGQDSLQYRDVIILCLDPRDANGMIQGLRNSGVPVGLLYPHCPDPLVHDAALATTDQVIVTEYYSVSGLERRVVVGLSGFGLDRLMGMSRCTAQLIWIDFDNVLA
ncbi:uncharacterized protein [Littorina saxatilis]|uniref:Uncharacterized protein n=1 Tax=Littorina saxatilis TaxID=31220 RepID=A0AAN9G3M1_9CAEN